MQMMAQRDVDPLNATLYSLLEHKFGEVRIASEGVSAHVQRLPDPLRPGTFVEQIHTWGEYYCVNCPFCNDTRHRLWINHTYGSDFNRNKRINTHLATCYNEDCIKKVPGRYEQLELLIFGAGRPIKKKTPIKAACQSFVAQPVEPPGEVCSIAGISPQHTAVKYLRSRNFNVDDLACDYDVGMCLSVNNPRYSIMRGRIYIPIVFNQMLVGWQGRATNDYSDPKYFNRPGWKRGLSLYNYDRARSESYVVVVEGVPSVWRIGPQAVALCGKTVSLFQQLTIATTWAGKPVVLLLDRNATPEMVSSTATLKARGVDVRPLYLPDDRDPADYCTFDINELIKTVL